MTYGISETSIIPVRRESDRKSEMITQILFGDLFQILEEGNEWSYIKLQHDNYEGWIKTNYISKLNSSEFDKINDSNKYIIKSFFEDVQLTDTQEIIKLPFACTLPNFNTSDKSFQIKDKEYKLIINKPVVNNYDISTLTKSLLNTPYLWGGKNPFGIDCSGFTQIIYKTLGYFIPRDANQQVSSGKTINFIADCQIGDLAFFDNEEGNITHVGIILNDNNIIHAFLKVRIDKIDQQGIFNKELNKYTHKLRIIKRIIN